MQSCACLPELTGRFGKVSDMNDIAVAQQLGEIRSVLQQNGNDVRRLEYRLFGREGEQDGGIVGNHAKQLADLQKWFIRVTTGIAVWVFMTGAGPVSLASILKLLAPGS